MSPFAAAVEEFVAAIENRSGWVDEFNALSRRIGGLLESAAPDEVAAALRRFAALLPTCPLVAAGLVAINCGSLVERGGDPAVAGPALLDGLPRILELTLEFARAARAEAEADEEFLAERKQDADDPDEFSVADVPVEDLAHRYGPEIYKEKPETVLAHMSQEFYALSVIAHQSRSKDLRAAARSRPELTARSRELDGEIGRRSFLTSLLQVLDDERLVVLHPAQGKGYELRISGIADNFQLHTLLAAALVGDPAEGRLAGRRPSPASVAAARGESAPGTHAEGVFNLWNWTGLRPDGTLPEGQGGDAHTHWIWNEGCPADIAAFEGVRIVLLGPPPYERSWSAAKVFSALTPEVSLERKLPREEVRAWLDRLAAAGSGRGG